MILRRQKYPGLKNETITKYTIYIFDLSTNPNKNFDQYRKIKHLFENDLKA